MALLGTAGVWAPEYGIVPGVTAYKPGVTGRLVVGVLAWDRLCCICALMRCPAARALIKESSPAMTAAAMMRARREAFSPGDARFAPRIPSMSRTACWGARTVPPPTVPTSMEGMVTEIRRSSSLLVLPKEKKRVNQCTAR